MNLEADYMLRAVLNEVYILQNFDNRGMPFSF